MDRICDYSFCSGCGACAGACPKGCISLRAVENNNGHILPEINQKSCIDCGLCQRVCPVNHHVDLFSPMQTFAAYARNNDVCNTSSSGGAAYTIAENILKQGGVVYGCAVQYGKDFGISHIRVENIDELYRTQSSKYVQSRIDRDIFRAIKRDLDEGRKVLFTGTGCQIAGVRNYIKKGYPNFYAVDIICHGVPSLKLLKDYLSLRYDISEIKKIRFRSKSEFNIYGVYGVYGVYGEPISLPLSNNLYMMGFMKGLYYRSACYKCRYACVERCGDITLGDFWGLKSSFLSRPSDSKGTSVILVNTEKGASLLEMVKADLEMMPRSLDEAVAGNPQLRQPSKAHFAYSVFRRIYPILGFKLSAMLCLGREKLFYGFALPLINKIQSRR